MDNTKHANTSLYDTRPKQLSTIRDKHTISNIVNAYVNCINSPSTTEWSDTCDQNCIKMLKHPRLNK